MNKSQKHIIIAGVPRSGKTTICSKLAKSLKYQHLAMDAIMISFEKAFPKTGVLHTDCWDFIETSEKFIPFMQSLSSTATYDKLGYRLVFDLYHITPKDYYENIDKDCCDIYFLGYPDVLLEDKFNEIRSYDTEYDWTSKESDSVVKEHLSKYIEISKWLEQECKKYNLPFINVSKNREQVIDNLVQEILKSE